MENIRSGCPTDFALDGDDVLRLNGKLCFPDMENLRQEILAEAHYDAYNVHPGSTKMYQDLKGNYWWRSMKKKKMWQILFSSV